CNTLKLTDLSVADIQLSLKPRKPAKFTQKSVLKSSSILSSFVKKELSSFSPNNSHKVSQSIPIMSETDDILEPEEIQR
ncbi:unnamed protein product, partial [Rotaria sp. Silwood1]